MVVKCPNCGSADIDSQESTGQSVCMECGMVLEENAITHSIEFQVRTEFTNWQNSIVLLSYTPVHFTSSSISMDVYTPVTKPHSSPPQIWPG